MGSLGGEPRGPCLCKNGLESKPPTLLALGWPGPRLSHLRLWEPGRGVSGPRETVMGHPERWLQARPREWGP